MKGPKPVPAIDRVMRRVDISGGDDACWPWTGATSNFGHGVVRLSSPRRMTRTHRVVLEHAIGRSLTNSEVACHRCDNPPCCNPRHLFVGTQADNVADMVAKGRAPTGERHYNARLADAAVQSIRGDDRPTREVAAAYGVTERYVRKIRQGVVRKIGAAS